MFNNIAASFMFFTRLPFWRVFKVPDDSFRQVINYWSATGWVTAPITAGVLFVSSLFLPIHIAAVVAILSRLLITGAFHEDGLADFFDGFGGGTTKERILAIMKDSHIGTYGVVSLVLYFLLLFLSLTTLPVKTTCIIILTGDPLCKFATSLITLRLPYARDKESSKAKIICEPMGVKTFFISATFGLLPTILLFPFRYWGVVIFPILVFYILTQLMKRKIQGYTGDCCGATFLICELSFFISVIIVMSNFQ